MFRSKARTAANIEYIGKVRNNAAGHPGKPRRARVSEGCGCVRLLFT